MRPRHDRGRRVSSGVAGLLAATLTLGVAGCTSEPTVVADSQVSVALDRGLTSMNDRSSFGGDPANREILQAVRSTFFAYDADGMLVADESFGTVEVVSYDPFTLHYRLSERAHWSDGVPVTAADLLLAWVAGSGTLDTPDFDDAPYRDPATGRYAEAFPPEVVHFDGPRNTGLELSDGLPTIDPDGLGLSIGFTRYLPDWPLLLEVGLPAHVVGARALPRSSDTDPAEEVVEAILEARASSLAALARVWNNDFDVAEVDLADELFVTNGPYRIESFEPDERLTLVADEQYQGDRSPRYERIRLWFMNDPAEQFDGFGEESLDVIAPQASLDSAEQAGALAGASVLAGAGSNVEHVVLRSSASRTGVFDDPLLREAFLLTVPRAEIHAEFAASIAPGDRLPDGYTRMPGRTASPLPAQNLVRARQLVEDSGAVNPMVCVLYDPVSPRRQAEFRLVRDSAAEAGFRVSDCSSPGWFGLLDAPGAWDAAIFAWNQHNTSTAALEAQYRLGGRTNVGRVDSPRLEGILDRLVVALDEAEREEILDELDAVLWSEGVGVPLYRYPRLVVVRDGVEGVRPGPLSGVLWNVWEWSPAPPEP